MIFNLPQQNKVMMRSFQLTKSERYSFFILHKFYRLKNRTEQFLVLDFRYAQNVRYFDFMLPEIRHLLAFSDDVQREGDQVLHRWNMLVAFLQNGYVHIFLLITRSRTFPIRQTAAAATSFRHNATAMCVHIRRSDFVQLHVASDLHDSVGDVIRIAERQVMGSSA